MCQGDRMAIRPLNDYVLIRRDTSRTKTDGGLHIPDAHRQKPLNGHVVACGPGRIRNDGTRDPMGVAPGAVVSFPHFHGEPLTVDGEELLFIRESELFGVVE